MSREALRALPPVDALAAEVDAPRAIAVAAARAVLAERRAELRGGDAGEADLAARARDWAAAARRPSLRRVINATGVIVHTNLGRAPLAVAAREAVARVAEGYCNVEMDVSAGTRGSRHAHVEELLCSLTGAEAAIAVNNCAGATLLAAAALAGPGREVIVSRGQLVEIGGGFRVPEVIAQAGARLVEVGTTNRTRRADYERAIGDATGAILRAHPSNFRQLGFVQEVEIEELCELGVPVIDDVGSGVLADDLELLRDEPPVRRSVAAGAALVCFSGDKLLGGPQAGLIVGRAEAVAAARAHPLARALRLDKLGLAALEATLRLYRDPDAARREIPVLSMLTTDERTLRERAERLVIAASKGTVAPAEESGAPAEGVAAPAEGVGAPAEGVGAPAEGVGAPAERIGATAEGPLSMREETGALRVELVAATARVGGGALPLLELPGPVVAVEVPGIAPDELAARLRAADPPVIGRIEGGRLLLDPRTLADGEIDDVARAVRAAAG